MFSDSIYDIFPQSYYTDYESEYDKRTIPNYSTVVTKNDKITVRDNDNTASLLSNSEPNTAYDLRVKQPNNAAMYGETILPQRNISNDGYKISGFTSPDSMGSDGVIVIQPIVLYFIMFIMLIFMIMQYQTNKILKKCIKNQNNLE